MFHERINMNSKLEDFLESDASRYIWFLSLFLANLNDHPQWDWLGKLALLVAAGLPLYHFGKEIIYDLDHKEAKERWKAEQLRLEKKNKDNKIHQFKKKSFPFTTMVRSLLHGKRKNRGKQKTQ